MPITLRSHARRERTATLSFVHPCVTCRHTAVGRWYRRRSSGDDPVRRGRRSRPALVLGRRPNVLAAARIESMQVVPDKALHTLQLVLGADGYEFLLCVAEKELMLKLAKVIRLAPQEFPRFQL